MVQGGAKSPKMSVLSHTSGVRIIRIRFFERGKNFCLIIRAKFGSGIRNRCPENHKLHFRDGRYNYACGIIFHFCKGNNDFDMSNVLSLTRWKNKRLVREEFLIQKTLKTKRATLKTSRFLRKQESGRLVLVIEKWKTNDCRSRKNLLGSNGRKSLPAHPLAHLRGDHESQKRRK